MALSYDWPEPTSNELASGWHEDDCPSAADYADLAQSRLMSEVAMADRETQSRIFAELDRIFSIQESDNG